jgi:hypothetical protein
MVGCLRPDTQPQANPVWGNMLAGHNRPAKPGVPLEGLLQTFSDKQKV